MRKILWSGKSTNGIWKKNEAVYSLIELFHACEANGTITNVDRMVYDSTVLEKFEKSETDEEFLDENQELDYEKIDEFVSKHELTDKEIYILISEQTGNAYYQTFEVEDENGNVKELDSNDFDENGEFIN